MPDILTSSSAYQGTYVLQQLVADPNFQLCAVANINASNQLEITFWLNRSGERVDSNLGQATYSVRDKAGNLVSGLSQSNISPDSNGYYHTTPVSAELIFDLNHYVLELDIPYDGVGKQGSIGLVAGD